MLRIEYGINNRHSGQLPYFYIKGDHYKNECLVECGAIHERILAARPEYADIVAMHLSDINGEPMHAVENGWYWLQASRGENYYESDRTSVECLRIFADYMRVSEGGALIMRCNIETKRDFEAWCVGMRPVWKGEAEALIRKYHLKPGVPNIREVP